MKALPFKIPFGSKSSIQVEHESLEQFYGHYHTHEEIQLSLFIRGHGIAYIGDQLIEFEPGNIFLIGPHLPHVFKAEVTNEDGVEAISIFFLKDFLGKPFLEVPETSLLAGLLNNASRGVHIKAKTVETIKPVIWNIKEASGFRRLVLLLETLQIMAKEKQHFITGPGYQKPRRQVDGEKINVVFDYLTSNYEKEISLRQIADIAHMSPTAFCRYFKQHTRKTYSRFLNEIRVSQACKLLQEKSEPISQIAYSAGFNNISNFNRQFKKITGKTPSEYQSITL